MAATTGISDGGGARVAARVQFWGEIGMGMHGGGAPKLIQGCEESLDGLKFELEIKSEFLLKMKSCEIQRLELVSDKIEAGDRKRKVLCVRFGCPLEKNVVSWSSPWKDGHGRSYELAEEGKEEDGEEQEQWAELAVGRFEKTTWGALSGWISHMGLLLLLPVACAAASVRKERKEERREKKKGKRKRKRKGDRKNGNILQIWILFQGEK
jgi:hypothetical protein